MAPEKLQNLYYTVKADHASASGDVSVLVDDINTDLADVPGFKSLSVEEFLALNAETLDNDAKARGFDRGARHEVEDADGKKETRYHLFVGAQVVAGTRDISKPIDAKKDDDDDDEK